MEKERVDLVPKYIQFSYRVLFTDEKVIDLKT